MNKKYIDFVPAKKSGSVKEPVESKRVVSDTKISSGVKTVSEVKTAPKVRTEVSELELNELFEARYEKPRAGVTMVKKAVSGAFKVPHARFVNTEKITKRPLSKNVYPKKVIVPEEPEEPKKLVTIINKPKKDSKIGMIVAIIITIILGAAAGTVAFLLLPN